MKRNAVWTLFFLGTVAAAAQNSTRSDHPLPKGVVEITNLNSYTLHPGDKVYARVGLWPYFAANQISNVPNPTFPDNLVFWAYGKDPGDCVFSWSQTFCINYRFQNAFQVDSTPVTDQTSVYLVDFNAVLLNRPEDPKGTAFAQLMASPTGNGATALGIVTVAVSERHVGMADALATQGLLTQLAGGSTAVPEHGTTMNIRLRIIPSGPSDAQSFTLGGYDPNIRIKDAIVVQANSSFYANMVNAAVVAVYVQPSTNI